MLLIKDLKGTGEIIAWINSDDLYCDNIFTKIADLFNNDNHLMWLYGNTYFIDENERIISYKKPIRFNSFVLKFGSFSFNQPGVFSRRRIIKDVGLLRDDFHAIMDQEWFCRIAEKYKPLYVNIDIAKFRWHSTSKSSSNKNSKHFKNLIYERQFLFEKYLPRLSFIYKKYPILLFSIVNFISRIIKVFYRLVRAINE